MLRFKLLRLLRTGLVLLGLLVDILHDSSHRRCVLAVRGLASTVGGRVWGLRGIGHRVDLAYG